MAGGPEHIVPFEQVNGTNVQKIGTRLLLAEDLGVKPGDVVTYYARARDIGRGKRSTETTSDIFFLEVKPFDERVRGGARARPARGIGIQQIDSLIQAQKEIISSTWNVERRAQGGRSTEDVKADRGGAGRAEGASGTTVDVANPPRARAGACARAPGPGASSGRATSGDPIAAAVDAMGKALQQLATEQDEGSACP